MPRVIGPNHMSRMRRSSPARVGTPFTLAPSRAVAASPYRPGTRVGNRNPGDHFTSVSREWVLAEEVRP